MKWLIASDLHGSAAHVEKLMRAFEREGADRLLLLGDLLSNGLIDANKDAVADMLNAMADKITCVRGNCDSDADVARMAFPIEEGYLAIPVGNKRMFATHGHEYNSVHLPPMDTGDILLHGHTHVPATEPHPDHLYLNPGSVSIPKWGSAHGYMTLANGVFRWMTLDGEEYRQYEV